MLPGTIFIFARNIYKYDRPYLDRINDRGSFLVDFQIIWF